MAEVGVSLDHAFGEGEAIVLSQVAVAGNYISKMMFFKIVNHNPSELLRSGKSKASLGHKDLGISIHRLLKFDVSDRSVVVSVTPANLMGSACHVAEQALV